MALRIGSLSLHQRPLDFSGNAARIRSALKWARTQHAQVLCLPELCISGYGCGDYFLHDWVLEKSWTTLQSLLADTHSLLVGLGLPFGYAGKRYCGLAVVHNTKMIGLYAKHHLAQAGVHYEPRWFSAWEAGRKATYKGYPVGELCVEVAGHSIGFEICEEAWVGFEKSNTPALDVVLSAHASAYSLGKNKRREAVVKARARHYKGVYVYANLLGNEAGRLIYGGEAMIASAKGWLFQSDVLSFRDMNGLVATLQNGDLKDITYVGLPPAPRRPLKTPDYEELTQAAALGLWDYMRNSQAKGFVLSLSGGADSAMCAVLVAEMLRRAQAELGTTALQAMLPWRKGKPTLEVLLALVYQKGTHSSKKSQAAASALAKGLGLKLIQWSVEQEIQSYCQKVADAIGHSLSANTHDIALQNVQARARVPALWLLANVREALLLVTANRSESATGYTTMDGDSAGALAPIAALPKAWVQGWLVWAEKKLNYACLSDVNKMKPSAELKANQADEAELMPYAVLHRLEELLLRARLSDKEALIALQKDPYASLAHMEKDIQRFRELFRRSQWKRDRIAPSLHLNSPSLDSKGDSRYPLW